MYPYNHDANTTQAYATTSQGYASNVAYTAPPPLPTASASATLVPTPAPTPPAFSPVQVPPGHYPIELIQFWRSEYKRGHPFPLHWALFVRTAPSPGPGSRPRRLPSTNGAPLTPRGNFYEIVGTPDTYTAQFLSNVNFEPDMLSDWRGSHVIGWVHPGQLPVFEMVVRQVPVWRHRADWRCQQWVYEVMRAVGSGYQGLFMDGVTFGGLQRHMGKLLDAWERGDI